MVARLEGKVFLVATEEFVGIVFEEVEFPSDGFRFVWFKASDAEVGMEAADHTLEEFLIGFPSGGEEPFVVGADAADESV